MVIVSIKNRKNLLLGTTLCLLCTASINEAVTMPTKEDVFLFKVLAPKMVSLIPDTVIAHDLPESVAQERKDKLRQFIIAGANLFDLALDIESGELKEALAEKLKKTRAEFQAANERLISKKTQLQTVAKELAAAPAQQRLEVTEQQIAVLLDMLEDLSNPLYSAAVLFQDLNTTLLSKLLKMLELMPMINRYLTVGDEKIMIKGELKPLLLSTFIQTKLKEMVIYTDNQRKIAPQVKTFMSELRGLYESCQKNLLEYKDKKQKQLKPELDTQGLPTLKEILPKQIQTLQEPNQTIQSAIPAAKEETPYDRERETESEVPYPVVSTKDSLSDTEILPQGALEPGVNKGFKQSMREALKKRAAALLEEESAEL